MIIILFIVLIVGYVGLSFYVASEMTKRGAPRLDATPKLVSENYKDIQFGSFDGLTLKGWLFKTTSNKLVIMIAGLFPNRVNVDYQGMWIAKDLVDEGYNVIMYDSRARGESGGNRASYGYNEGKDVVSVVDFAKGEGFKKENIALLGDSTGAVAVLMAAPDLKDVGALIIDTATSDYKPNIVDRLWVEKKVPPFFSPGIFFFTDRVFGLNINGVKPIEKMPQVGERNFLFLHGGLDETFPVEESKKLLAAANPASKLVVFPNGNHIETFKSDPKLFRKEVFDFLEQELGD